MRRSLAPSAAPIALGATAIASALATQRLSSALDAAALRRAGAITSPPLMAAAKRLRPGRRFADGGPILIRRRAHAAALRSRSTHPRSPLIPPGADAEPARRDQPEDAGETLRYRCARLAENGLAGRSRPYRERGSAPFQLWPTRKGEAVVKGGPPPRGGDRSEPNPLFLSHAAGLSEIYVALERTLPSGVKLTRFEREGEAREEFTVLASRDKRAIAPDLFIEIADSEGQPLAAFVELDMGSMSHRRLAQKAAGLRGLRASQGMAAEAPVLPRAFHHHD